MPYLSVQRSASFETVIEKSRFIGYASHAESEEEARAFLARLKAEHPLATHICFAFVADRLGNVVRFSDDGEPQGTAGMPILGAIRAQKLFETVVAVVRYFGGIKLGAGGLTRAYASSANSVISSAGIARYEDCVILSIKTDYSHVNALLRIVEGEKLPCEREFGEEAELVLTVREAQKEGVLNRLRDATSGRIKFEELSRTVAPFPIDE